MDPVLPVPFAVVTHAHSDHARAGSTHYLAHKDCVPLLKIRLGKGISIQGLNYGEWLRVGEVKLRFLPAGHILGSSQVQIEANGYSWVLSGDYKRDSDPTCPAFEPIRCHVFISESTFAMPIYQWEDSSAVVEDIGNFWKENQENDYATIIECYSLGKCQRILAGLNSIGSIFLHPSAYLLTKAYESQGILFPPYQNLKELSTSARNPKPLLMLPPNFDFISLEKEIGKSRSGFASGWMQIKKRRTQSKNARNFSLSDHADWTGLNRTIQEVSPERILIQHGFTEYWLRHLKELGKDAEVI